MPSGYEVKFVPPEPADGKLYLAFRKSAGAVDDILPLTVAPPVALGPTKSQFGLLYMILKSLLVFPL